MASPWPEIISAAVAGSIGWAGAEWRRRVPTHAEVRSDGAATLLKIEEASTAAITQVQEALNSAREEAALWRAEANRARERVESAERRVEAAEERAERRIAELQAQAGADAESARRALADAHASFNADRDTILASMGRTITTLQVENQRLRNGHAPADLSRFLEGPFNGEHS